MFVEAQLMRSRVRLDARSPTEDPDRTLLEAFRADARAGFERIVGKFLRQVIKLVRRFGLSIDEAEDVSQEVFLRVWRGLPSFRGEARLRSWILRIAVREASRRLAGRRQFANEPLRPAETIPAPQESPVENASQVEREAYLRQALERLPGKHRKVIVLRYLEELSCEEVSEVLGCSVGTVHSRLHHARKKLKRIMKSV